eukprot:scaffold131_cov335-Pavlova_lutheri.AAC.19
MGVFRLGGTTLPLSNPSESGLRTRTLSFRTGRLKGNPPDGFPWRSAPPGRRGDVATGAEERGGAFVPPLSPPLRG